MGKWYCYLYLLCVDMSGMSFLGYIESDILRVALRCFVLSVVTAKSWENVEEDESGNIVTKNMYNADKVSETVHNDEDGPSECMVMSMSMSV